MIANTRKEYAVTIEHQNHNFGPSSTNTLFVSNHNGMYRRWAYENISLSLSRSLLFSLLVIPITPSLCPMENMCHVLNITLSFNLRNILANTYCLHNKFARIYRNMVFERGLVGQYGNMGFCAWICAWMCGFIICAFWTVLSSLQCWVSYWAHLNWLVGINEKSNKFFSMIRAFFSHLPQFNCLVKCPQYWLIGNQLNNYIVIRLTPFSTERMMRWLLLHRIDAGKRITKISQHFSKWHYNDNHVSIPFKKAY